jgi:stalled ribosome alternative rescue factor ArfA
MKNISTAEPCGLIYYLLNLRNNKGYVGQHCTENEDRRWNGHYYAARDGGSKLPLHNAMRKAHKESKGASWGFSAEVIWRGPISLLNTKEAFFIKKFNTFIDDGAGYNLTRGGNSAARSERTKQLQSEAIKALYKDDEFRARMYAATWGSDAFRNKVTAALREVWADPDYRAVLAEVWEDPAYREAQRKAHEWQCKDPVQNAARSARAVKYWGLPANCARQSKLVKALWKDQQYRDVQVNAKLLYWQDEDYRAMQTESHKRYFVNNPEARVNLSIINTGKKTPKRTKAKQSASALSFWAAKSVEERAAHAKRIWEARRRNAALKKVA